MQVACFSTAAHMCFLGVAWLIAHVSKTKKIEYFHSMDPSTKTINVSAVDGYVWAVTV